jgi:cytoskeletal protein RodZ
VIFLATVPAGCEVGQFGDKFRKAREKKGISLDDVSNVTKISSRMLQAIEEEHFDQLPGGVFNKGFIRAYARHVGLNDEEAVNEYLACLRQAQIDAQAVWEPNVGPGKRPQVAAHQIAANQAVAGKVSHRVTRSAGGQTEVAGETEELSDLQLPRLEHVSAPRRAGQRRNPVPWRPVVIALLLIVAVGVVWQRRMRHARAEGAASATSSLPTSPAPAIAVPVPSADQPAQASASRVHNASAAKSVGLTHLNTSAGTKPAEARKTEGDDEGASADNTAGAVAAATVPAENTPARFRLVIHADENSWISVTADGQPVSHETLIAPADASIHANREIVARIGNAAGVSFIWNGQEFQPQGAEAEVKTFVFDENGMHEVGSGQATSQAH